MLRKWRSKHGPTATYRNLANCFYQADMLEMVEVVCQALRSPRQQQGIPHVTFLSKLHWLHIYIGFSLGPLVPPISVEGAASKLVGAAYPTRIYIRFCLYFLIKLQLQYGFSPGPLFSPKSAGGSATN